MKEKIKFGWIGLTLAWLLWAMRGCEECPAQSAPFQTFGTQWITNSPAFSNAVSAARTPMVIMTNYPMSFFVTNGIGGGTYFYSAGLSTNFMLCYTNIVGPAASETNFYMTYNDEYWRQVAYIAYNFRMLAGAWDEGTNFPDGPFSFPQNAYFATNGVLNGSMSWEASAKNAGLPPSAATLLVTNITWNTTTNYGGFNNNSFLPVPAATNY